MSGERIDFISAYCDRWCGRCRFTDRCSTFAGKVAAERCGDFADALELAAGTPRPVDGETLIAMARGYTRRASRWLDAHRDRLARDENPVVRDALEVVGWDACLVGAKLHRALQGRDGARRGECRSDDDDPVQNDWNGSAKVASISLERSASAWQVIAGAADDAEAAALSEAAGALRQATREEFPRALDFVRPGFDEVDGQ